MYFTDRGIEELEAALSHRVDHHLATNRIRGLRDVLEAPDLDEVRSALAELVAGVQGRADGSSWLLVGEGPLGTEDIRLLPLDDPEGAERTRPSGHDDDPAGARGAAHSVAWAESDAPAAQVA